MYFVIPAAKPNDADPQSWPAVVLRPIAETHATFGVPPVIGK